MKILKKILSLLPVLAGLAGCVNDADVSNANTSIDDGNGNVRFLIETPAISALTRGAETSGDYESGTENEFAVKRLDVYLFDSDTKMFMKCVTFSALTITSGSEGVSDTDPSVATVVYQSPKAEIDPGKYDFFAVANADDPYTGLSDVDEFINRIDVETYKQGIIEAVPSTGFLMTNRAAQNLNKKIEWNESGVPTRITFSMERAVAKIEIGTKEGEYPLTDDKKEKYATINLTNYKVVNLPNQFYIFRHVAMLTELNKPTFDININFGSIPGQNGYAIDPYFFKKKVDASDFDNSDGYYNEAIVDLSNTSNWSSMPSTNGVASLYSLENCMISEAQKNAYTTGVMFKASLTPKNVYKLDNDENLVPDSDRAAIIYYFNYNFYNSLAALKKAGVKKIDVNKEDYTDEELSAFSVKRFKLNSGVYECYYNYWIKHFSQDELMGVMEFGIVRNNLYRLKISGVSGLGSGTPEIDPDKPDEPNTYIDVAVEVKPWIVRSQGDVYL